MSIFLRTLWSLTRCAINLCLLSKYALHFLHTWLLPLFQTMTCGRKCWIARCNSKLSLIPLFVVQRLHGKPFWSKDIFVKALWQLARWPIRISRDLNSWAQMLHFSLWPSFQSRALLEKCWQIKWRWYTNLSGHLNAHKWQKYILHLSTLPAAVSISDSWLILETECWELPIVFTSGWESLILLIGLCFRLSPELFNMTNCCWIIFELLEASLDMLVWILLLLLVTSSSSGENKSMISGCCS